MFFSLSLFFISFCYVVFLLLWLLRFTFVGFLILFVSSWFSFLVMFFSFVDLDFSCDFFVSFGFDFGLVFRFDCVSLLFLFLVLVIFSVWLIHDSMLFNVDSLMLLSISSLLYLSFICLLVGNVGLFVILLECLSVPVIFFFISVSSSDWFLGLSYMLVYSGFTGLFGFSSLVGLLYFDWFWCLSSLSSFFLLLLSLSFLVKSAFYPFHTWLPFAHGLCGTGGSVFLAGIFLKLGGYGLVRLFSFYVYSDVFLFFQYVFVCFSFFGMFLSSMSCVFQVDVKKLIAFSSVCHMNFTVLVFFLGGVVSSVMVWFSHGFITSLLFFLFGWVYSFSGSRLVWFYGNMWIVKVWWVFWFFVVLVNSGLPPFLSFSGEVLGWLFIWQWSNVLSYLLVFPFVYLCFLGLVMLGRFGFGFSSFFFVFDLSLCLSSLYSGVVFLYVCFSFMMVFFILPFYC